MPTATVATDPTTTRYLELVNDRTEWTMPDIARELKVMTQTVRSWRKDALTAERANPTAPPHPHHLPKADVDSHGRPVWYAGSIRKWAMQTGRMSQTGEPQRLKPPGRPRGNAPLVPAAA